MQLYVRICPLGEAVIFYPKLCLDCWIIHTRTHTHLLILYVTRKEDFNYRGVIFLSACVSDSASR